jgi:VanZ family protein
MAYAHRRRNRSIDGFLWFLFVSTCAATLWFSLAEVPPGDQLFHGADKVQHAAAYFALTLTFLLAAVWRPGRGWGRWPNLGVPFCLGIVLVGVAIEILQGVDPGRDAQVSDVIAEAIGAVIALVCIVVLRRLTTRRLATSTSGQSR